jgi:DNA-binding IclR family transcriptional regulator
MHPPRRRLLDIADPLLREAANRMGQSIHLAIWDDGEFVITSSVSAPGNWRLSLRVGSVIGLYNTGSGLVMAAFQDEAMRSRMVREHQLVDSETVMAPEQFEATIRKIRAQGYAREPSAYTRGVINLSFPVLDPFGNAFAAVTCPYVEHLNRRNADIESALACLRETAWRMTNQLNGKISEAAE